MINNRPANGTAISTYGTRLRARLAVKGQPGFGSTKSSPPPWVLEKMYQEKLLGGFNKKSRCARCNTCLPLTNICDYCE